MRQTNALTLKICFSKQTQRKLLVTVSLNLAVWHLPWQYDLTLWTKMVEWCFLLIIKEGFCMSVSCDLGLRKLVKVSSFLSSLCLKEKQSIVYKPELSSLNKRNELISACRLPGNFYCLVSKPESFKAFNDLNA